MTSRVDDNAIILVAKIFSGFWKGIEFKLGPAYYHWNGSATVAGAEAASLLRRATNSD